MVRSPSIDKNGIRKGEWSKEEDDKLRAYINKYGIWNWRQLPRFAGLSRCGKSCRLRWKNYLQPNVKRGNYTKEEEELIFNLHNQLGKKWSVIATKLPGRTDNEIKNYWHTHLKKRTEAEKVTKPSNQKKMKAKSQTSQIPKEKIKYEPSQSEGLANSPNDSCCSETSDIKIEDCHESPQGSCSSEMSFGCSDLSDIIAWAGEDDFMTPASFEGLDDFWSQSIFGTDNYMINAYEHEQVLMDPGLVCPSSLSSHEDVFLWSYDLSNECIM